MVKWIRILLLAAVAPTGTLGQDATDVTSGRRQATIDAARAALSLMSETPFDWENSVEIESGENSAHGGVTHYSRVCYVDGVWLLKQRDNTEESWHDNALLVEDGTVYFAEVGDEPSLFRSGCVTCHPNGPRAVRGELRHGTPELLAALNERVRETEVVRPFFPPTYAGGGIERLALSPCNQCHDGKTRAYLFGFNAEPIRYLFDNGHMPPPEVEITEKESRSLYEWLDAVEQR